MTATKTTCRASVPKKRRLRPFAEIDVTAISWQESGLVCMLTQPLLKTSAMKTAWSGSVRESDSVTVLTRNYCHDNKTAGIGFSKCSSGQSTLTGNRVINNAKVAIGINPGWNITATGNELSRDAGIPPIVMIFAGSKARFTENTIQGTGVAGIRVAGELEAVGNRFVCPKPRKGGPPSIGVWVLKGSTVSQSNNTFEGWRTDVRNDGVQSP